MRRACFLFLCPPQEPASATQEHISHPIDSIPGRKLCHTAGRADPISVYKAGACKATFKATMQNLAVTCFALSHAHFKEGMLTMSNKSAPAKHIHNMANVHHIKELSCETTHSIRAPKPASCRVSTGNHLILRS